MSIWEQRRKEREEEKGETRVTKFNSVPQSSEEPIELEPKTSENVVKSSVVNELTKKNLEDEYGRGQELLPAPLMMDFDEFHANGGMAGVVERNSQYGNVLGNEAMIPKGNENNVVENAENMESNVYEQPEAQQYEYNENNERQAYEEQPESIKDYDLAPEPLEKSKKPSEMTEEEYEEYENKREMKAKELLIKKVLYDKEVSTFDQEECKELAKIDEKFAAMFEEEKAKKELAELEAQRKLEQRYEEQQNQSVKAQKLMANDEQYEETNYKEDTLSENEQDYELLQDFEAVLKDNKILEEKNENLDFMMEDQEKLIDELQNQITDERQERIQANKNLEECQKNIEELKTGLLHFKEKYEELKDVVDEQNRLEEAVKLADMTYKPSSPGKPSMVDELMANCNEVLEEYASLEDTMQKSMRSINYNGTIKVDDESPIRGIGVEEIINEQIKSIQNDEYVPGCLTDDTTSQLNSILPESKFEERPKTEE